MDLGQPIVSYIFLAIAILQRWTWPTEPWQWGSPRTHTTILENNDSGLAPLDPRKPLKNMFIFAMLKESVCPRMESHSLSQSLGMGQGQSPSKAHQEGRHAILWADFQSGSPLRAIVFYGLLGKGCLGIKASPSQSFSLDCSGDPAIKQVLADQQSTSQSGAFTL